MKVHLMNRQIWRKHMVKKMRIIVRNLIAATLSVSLALSVTGCAGNGNVVDTAREDTDGENRSEAQEVVLGGRSGKTDQKDR